MFEEYQQVWGLANNRKITKIMKKCFLMWCRELKLLKWISQLLLQSQVNQSNKTAAVRLIDILTGMKSSVTLVL